MSRSCSFRQSYCIPSSLFSLLSAPNAAAEMKDNDLEYQETSWLPEIRWRIPSFELCLIHAPSVHYLAQYLADLHSLSVSELTVAAPPCLTGTPRGMPSRRVLSRVERHAHSSVPSLTLRNEAMPLECVTFLHSLITEDRPPVN